MYLETQYKENAYRECPTTAVNLLLSLLACLYLEIKNIIHALNLLTSLKRHQRS